MHNVMTDEIWKDIEGYEGVYMVSNCGRIKNCNRNKLLNPWANDQGYKKVELTRGSIKVIYSVHRLVAIAFLPNPDDLATVDHIDTDKANNFVSNLRWCTQADNARWANAKGFEMLSPSGSVVSFHNMTEFCREHGLTQANMHMVHSGKRKSHKGWRSLNAH